MREEKKYITAEYTEKLNSSPFFIVVDFEGLVVAEFEELRKRLAGQGSKIQVVKNQLFRIAVKDAGLGEIKDDMTGQCAFISGESDCSAAAKVVKNFAAEFKKPEVKFGYLDNARLEKSDVESIADLPSFEVVRGTLLGTILSPATTLARLINTPGSQIAQVLKAKSEKGE